MTATPHGAPSSALQLWRGLTRRCARCGSGRLFRRWFSMVPDCPGCGLHFEREQGYFAGALAINIILVGGIFTVGLVVALALTIPDVPVAPLLSVFVPLMLIGPAVLYPVSKTLWVAVDRAFLQRLGAHEGPQDRSGRF